MEIISLTLSELSKISIKKFSSYSKISPLNFKYIKIYIIYILNYKKII